MLTLPFPVPEAALIDRDAIRLARLTREAGGFWLRGADGRDEDWPAREGEALARPASGAPVFAEDAGRRVLQLTPGENRGVRVPDAAPDARRWSAAILWTSGADAAAQALLAVRPERGGNPVHLFETDERNLELRSDACTGTATLPPGEGRRWRLTVLSCGDDTLSLSQDGQLDRAQEVVIPEGPAQLLIGCRSTRAGMRKTLGGGRIAEVLFWPGVDILSDPAGMALRSALDDFSQWET